MFQAHGSSKQTCSLLAVLSGKISDREKPDLGDSRLFYPLPELVSSGRLEIRTLNNPTVDEFRQVFQSWNPNFVYLQGEQLLNEEEVGPLVWGGVNLSTPEAILRLFGPIYPTSVYLEVPNGGNLAEVLHSEGVPYVIYWKNSFLSYAASHFRQALFSVIQSSCTHTWDAFQVAHASFRLYCGWTNHALSKSQRISGKISPCLLGEAPKTIITLPEKDMSDEEALPGALPAIKIYDDDVDMKFLICGVPCTLDACFMGSLEDGLNALLRIEMRGSKLHNRVSAPPPPLQAGTFSRGVVTMKCDLSTCSSAHISILVSGSAQTCFDDQLLEDHIKNELTEKSQLVRILPNCEERNAPFPEPRKSVSIACGATVVEVCMKVPRWASQVLRQLAPEVTYRSFVALGIACIQGTSVASFERADANCLLFFYRRQGKDHNTENFVPCILPSWYKVPDPCRKRFKLSLETKLVMDQNRVHSPKRDQDKGKETGIMEARQMLWVPVRPKRKIAAMRPVPHTRKQKHNMLPFSGAPEVDIHDACKGKANLPIFTTANKSPVEYTAISNRKALSSSYQTHQIISLNPLPLKKHGCGRCPIQVCSEEEFLMDVMEFLILRGHSRLVPPGGLAEFPDAILNAKRLDLYNLYKEVVSRGGFHVGNGINWKGQVFSKMRNHTVTNRMTGVGNTLKRHYETYLLEYELAHDDVDGECCLLCHKSDAKYISPFPFAFLLSQNCISFTEDDAYELHSSSAGDWVNCGMCGEWAHFGCDRRQGLGAFKDYAKTDGLEYICPHCSLTGFRIKSQRSTNGC